MSGIFDLEGMEITTFTQLGLQQKEDLILEEGRFVADRIVNKYRILLYSVNRFYVEVWCLASSLRVERIEPLLHDNVLDLYVRHININSLLTYLN